MTRQSTELADAKRVFTWGFWSPHTRSGFRRTWPRSYTSDDRLTLHSIPTAVKATAPTTATVTSGFFMLYFIAIAASRQLNDTMDTSIWPFVRPTSRKRKFGRATPDPAIEVAAWCVNSVNDDEKDMVRNGAICDLPA